MASWVPYNIASNRYGTPISVAFKDAVAANNIPVHLATEENVGKLFHSVMREYAPSVVQIYGDEQTFLGTGTRISPSLVLTTAHLFQSTVCIWIYSEHCGWLTIQRDRRNEKLDYALFEIEPPVDAISYPSLCYDGEENHFGAYGMLHYGSGSLSVSVGTAPSTGYSNWVPYGDAMRIDTMMNAGQGASGALLFNDKKEGVALHCGRDPAFGITKAIPLSKIIADEFYLYGSSWLKTAGFWRSFKGTPVVNPDSWNYEVSLEGSKKVIRNLGQPLTQEDKSQLEVGCVLSCQWLKVSFGDTYYPISVSARKIKEAEDLIAESIENQSLYVDAWRGRVPQTIASTDDSRSIRLDRQPKLGAVALQIDDATVISVIMEDSLSSIKLDQIDPLCKEMQKIFSVGFNYAKGGKAILFYLSLNE